VIVLSRAERLLELIQLLRRHRRPVSAAALAAELGVSLRSVYRDVKTLNLQGAHIDGEPGMGYVLRPGFMLPPLMFSEEEIEALVLGSRWVAQRADTALGQAARNALAKIGAVLPPDLRDGIDDHMLLVGRRPTRAVGDAELATIRRAIRGERKLRIRYTDERGAETRRVIWPIALGFFERIRVVAAWCELRGDFRHFRTDRIVELGVTGARYPRGRRALAREWRETEGIPPL
jgi:predicted DNA-binding transcriptional regulator YafY